MLKVSSENLCDALHGSDGSSGLSGSLASEGPHLWSSIPRNSEV